MPRSINHVVVVCGVLALSIAAEGCQQRQPWDLAPVEGTVTKDGRPLANIEVVFLAEADAGTQGPRASGTTDKAGHYRLRSHNGDGGVVVGKHRILVTDLETAMKQQMGRISPEMAKRLKDELKKVTEAPRVPPSYGRFDKTPLRVEVRPGPQTLDFDLP